MRISEIRFYFSSIELTPRQKDLGAAPMLVTHKEELTPHEVIRAWKKRTDANDAPTFDLGEKKNRRGEEIHRKLLVVRVHDLPEDEVVYFHIWKVSTEIADTMILNINELDLANIAVQRIKELAGLNDMQGAITHCVCAYDYRKGVLAWRDMEGISKREIEYIFSHETDRKAQLINLQDMNSDRDFDLLNVENISLDLEVLDMNVILDRLVDTKDGIPEAAAKLREMSTSINSGRVKVTFFAEKGRTEKYLRKDVLQQNVPFWQKVLGQMNAGRRPRDSKKGRLRAEGIMPDKGGVDVYESRVIDLFEGLLIKKVEYQDGITLKDIFINYEQSCYTAVKQARRVYEP